MRGATLGSKGHNVCTQRHAGAHAACSMRGSPTLAQRHIGHSKGSVNTLMFERMPWTYLVLKGHDTKVNAEFPHDPANLGLRIYPEELAQVLQQVHVHTHL